MESNTGNIVHQGMPSVSALRVATLRAVHALLDDPVVFDDPFALTILGSQTAAALVDDPFQYNDPFSRGVRAFLVVRNRFAEEGLLDAVQRGVKQYVILGGGLDTFSLRNIHAPQGLHVYEVDHPSTQIWKKELLQKADIGLPQTTSFVAVDFEKTSLADALREAGFQADQPAYFSWLGVTLYLTKEAIFNTFRFVASLPEGSAITFDYGKQRSLLNPIERLISEHIGKKIAEQGEPWISFFAPESLAEDLLTLGFSKIKDLGAEELNARYFARRKDGLRINAGSRLMQASI